MREDSRSNRCGNNAWWQVGIWAQQFGAVWPAFTKHGGRVRHAVKLVFDRQFDERALFFNHHYFVETSGELFHDVRLKRRHHAQLENTDTGGRQTRSVDAQSGERLVQVKIRHACDHEPNLRHWVAFNSVQAIGPGVAPRQFWSNGHQAAFNLRRLHLVHEVGRDHMLVGLSVKGVVGDDGTHLLFAH